MCCIAIKKKKKIEHAVQRTQFFLLFCCDRADIRIGFIFRIQFYILATRMYVVRYDIRTSYSDVYHRTVVAYVVKNMCLANKIVPAYANWHSIQYRRMLMQLAILYSYATGNSYVCVCVWAKKSSVQCYDMVLECVLGTLNFFFFSFRSLLHF